MGAIRHILVPHDFGETAQHAFDFAMDLADKLGAKVTVVHAYEVPVYGFPDGVVLTAEMSGQIERAARAALDGVAARGRRPSVDVQVALRQGAAWSEIDAAAQQLEADLIVMGTHARRGVARALLGSVAEKVVRTSPVPVLTVHG
jgi:nucleotide-binding universal stress UspA family protein